MTPSSSRIRGWRTFASLVALSLSAIAFASDHADPMSLNVFKVQESPEANITDLHAFIADRDGHPLSDRAPTVDDCLVVSLCMRRALLPDDAGGLDLDGYDFRVHIDLDPAVVIFDPAKTRGGKDYAAERSRLEAAIAQAMGAERPPPCRSSAA